MTPNRSELGRYTGMDTEGEELEAAMRRMKEMGAAHIVTTLGADGSAYLDAVLSMHTIQGHKVPVVDTTGAGDCYNAGLAISIAAGRSLEEAIAFASLVSALAVTKFGAQAGMPTETESRRFAEEQGRQKRNEA
jgi:ribokinase